jgi:hypothetical protein
MNRVAIEGNDRLTGPQRRVVSLKYLVFWPGMGFIVNKVGGVYELDLRAFQDR